MNEALALRELAQAEEAREAPRASLVTLVGASGGVGRSSIALLMALLAAGSGIETVLIEGDLQFGDYAYWLGLDDTLPDLGLGQAAAPVRLSDCLSLFKAPVFPEIAEEVCDQVAEGLARMRAGAELAIADAGSYWCGLTARLLLESDLFLVLVDPRPASVYGAVRAVELCARLGVPSTRMAAVYNRWSPKAALSAAEVGRMLGASQVYCIPEGKAAVDRMVSGGDAQGLIAAGNPMAKGVRSMLASVLPRVGCTFDEDAKGRGGLFR